jgi:hypothetical protein
MDVALDVAKRKFVQQTLEQLETAAPEGRTKNGLQHLITKLGYTAPELMDNSWVDLYDYLVNQGELEELQTIWNTAAKEYPR